MSLNQIIDQNTSAPLVCDATLNLKAENLRVESSITANSLNVVNINGSPYIPIPSGGAVNSVLVDTVSGPAWENALTLNSVQFSASPSPNLFNYYAIINVPCALNCYDGTTFRSVTQIGAPTTALQFTRIGNLVTVYIPPVTVSAYSGGPASQQLAFKFSSPLPANLLPALNFTGPIVSGLGSTVLTTPGRVMYDTSYSGGYFLANANYSNVEAFDTTGPQLVAISDGVYITYSII